MPQFLIDWNQWWLNVWIDHPIAFWIAAIGVVGLVFGRQIGRWIGRR